MAKISFILSIKLAAATVAALMTTGCGGADGGSASTETAGAASVPITVVPTLASTTSASVASASAASAAPSQAAVAPTALGVPALLGDVAIEIPDILISAEAKVANVRVRLSRPADRQIAFNYLTSNGTAIEGAQFTRAQGTLTFRPGEVDKVIPVSVNALTLGKYFKLNVGWTKNVPAIGGSSGKIIGGTSTDSVSSTVPAYELADAAATRGRQQVFSSNFQGPVSPSGGHGVWRTRFDWGRWQSGNKEAAPYVDAATDPGTNPHPIVDGYRTLRAEKVPTRDGANNFAYSASMLSTQGWYSFQYGYVTLRAKVQPEAGVTPAFWLLPSNGEWPPEIDIFEFLNGGPLTSTVHFKDNPKGSMEGFSTDFRSDGGWHTYSLDWTPDWLITLVDGKEVNRRRNIFKQPMYIIVNTAVGLLSSGPPNATGQWHNDMTLDRIDVYQ